MKGEGTYESNSVYKVLAEQTKGFKVEHQDSYKKINKNFKKHTWRYVFVIPARGSRSKEILRSISKSVSFRPVRD